MYLIVEQSISTFYVVVSYALSLSPLFFIITFHQYLLILQLSLPNKLDNYWQWQVATGLEVLPSWYSYSPGVQCAQRN